MGGAGHSRLRARVVRRRAGPGAEAGGYRNRAATPARRSCRRGIEMMTGQLEMPLAPELALFALAVFVLLAGLIRPGREIGWMAFIGLLLIFGMMHFAPEGQVLFGGAFVQDALALFAKRLFVGATALSLLGSLTIGHATFDRRASEYHFAMLVSLLGMLVLASARELILLFVA